MFFVGKFDKLFIFYAIVLVDKYVGTAHILYHNC